MATVAPQQAEAQRLHTESRDAKREERRQRQIAKDRAVERDELLAECKRLGIKVVLHEVNGTDVTERTVEPGATASIAREVHRDLRRTHPTHSPGGKANDGHNRTT